MKIEPIAPHMFADDLKGSKYVVPVRNQYDYSEFFLTGELGADADHAKQLADKTNLEAGPSWAKANPVVRYQPIKLIAIPNDD